MTNKMDSIKNQFPSRYRNEQRKEEKAIQQLLAGGGRARREERNLLKRYIPFAVVQRNVSLEKF